MPPGPTRGKAIATLGVLVALLAGAATLQAAIGGGQAATAPRVTASAGGSMSLTNSKDGGAIFTLANIGPGDGGQGEVTLENSGTAPGSLALASIDRSDTPGRYGGTLSERLMVRIEDVSPSAPTEIYDGQLDAMPELTLGTLAVGESRTYRFAVTMLDDGPPSSPYVDDNLYQRGSASIGYEWSLTEVEAGGVEPGEPSEPPVGAPTPAPATPAPAEPVPPPAAQPPPGSQRHLKQEGTAAADVLVGTSEDDVIFGRGGADRIFGGGGNDYLDGGAGADWLYGGGGTDRLRGGAGSDHLFGGPGPDVILARGGGVDFVNCGGGHDVAYVDKHDRVKNCE
jgi:Ca2+-binding RTX toxin-like protein